MFNRVKSRIYKYFGEFDFLDFVSNFEFDTWLEAGCHDGLDTRKMFSAFPDVFAYGFEPDRVAFQKASKNLSEYNNRITLSNLALSDKAGELSMKVRNGLGSGHTQFLKTAKDSLEKICCSTLDHELHNKNIGRAVLWLDVEGHAAQVLRGATRTLRIVDLAKIEVQMHDLDEDLKSDAFEIICILREFDLLPRFLPIHPGYFGDILFVRKSLLSRRARLISTLQFAVFKFLHGFLYPRLDTPPKHPIMEKKDTQLDA